MRNKNKLNKIGANRKLLLIGIVFILLFGAIFLVGALTGEEELSQLEQEISDAGYGWLVEHNVSSPTIEVYEFNSSEKIAEFDEIVQKKLRIDELRGELK